MDDIYQIISIFFAYFWPKIVRSISREGLLLYIVHTLAQYCGKTSQFLHKITILFCLITFPIGAEKSWWSDSNLSLRSGGKSATISTIYLSRNPKPYRTKTTTITTHVNSRLALLSVLFVTWGAFTYCRYMLTNTQ